MRTRAALLVAALTLGGCGGGDDEGSIFTPEAVAAADSFVRALVADGDPVAARTYAVGAAAKNVGLWHDYLVRNGVQSVEGPGGQRANCLKPFPVFARPRGGDCVVYRLRGLTPIAGTDRTLVTTARLRVWLYEHGGVWRVSDFDFSPRLEAR
jgi:hypothetical protein